MPELNEAQQEGRRGRIGGSDVPVLLGGGHKTQVQLWLEKLGRAKPLDISDKPSVRMGHLLEPVVCELFTQETGKRVRQQNKPRVHREIPYMVANIDRDVVGERAGLEAKAWSLHSRHDWGPIGSDEVPWIVAAQCAHYMAVYDYDRWYVCVLLGGADFRWYQLERSQSLETRLLEVEARFWEHVEKRTPPPLQTPEDFAAVYDAVRGSKIVATSSAYAACDWYREARRKIREAEQERDQAAMAIMTAMGSHELLVATDGRTKLASWKASRPQPRVDWEAAALHFAQRAGLASDRMMAEIHEEGLTQVSEARRTLRVTEPRD